MSSESNISVGQKIMISRYLYHHLGHRACAPQQETSKVGALHDKFKQDEIYVHSSKYVVKKVDCFFKELF